MKKLGFGCMRLPMLENGEVDLEQFSKMVDAFLAAGFTYFDTAHNYIGGKSEQAIRACLTSRYPREQYSLTDKLTSPLFETEADIRPLLTSQLEACGVDYFDYCLLHSVNSGNYEKYTACNAFAILQEWKQEGKIRHVGMSFHDTPEMLDRILTEHPELEVVQIQFNYLDEANPNVESRRCYEVCRRHGKPVLVMEPVKGGALADLPPEAGQILEELGGGSPASYAIRYAASQKGILTVLSGMSNLAQVEDNIGYMSDFQPVTAAEEAALVRAREVILKQETIPCTACRYCTDGCPQQIPIPDIFRLYNRKKTYLEPGWGYGSLTKDKGKASDCVGCGQCEQICPQKLEIRRLLQDAAAIFEK